MNYYLGLDLGGTQIRGGIVDDDGNIVLEKAIPTKLSTSSIVDRLFDLIRELISEYQVKAIGIGVPGPIDFGAGLILNPPNLPELNNVPLKQKIDQEFNLPVAMDRDANCALIGEHWVGIAKGMQNIALITWGTGVGGAVIIDNKIYRGHSGLADEIGHMIIDKDGPECSLGHRGCLETFIGGANVQLRYGKSLEEITAGGREGQERDREIVREIGEYLKIGLMNIVTLYDPELIIIDGGAAQSLDVFLLEIGDLPVRVSPLAKEAGILGAARLVSELI
ncbi:MAG: ROK family protein [bacterium]|nr:ROK family protein [bacterium]